MLWEDVIHIPVIANPRIQDQRIANSLGRVVIIQLFILNTIFGNYNKNISKLDKCYDCF